jgi:hypothetical protein
VGALRESLSNISRSGMKKLQVFMRRVSYEETGEILNIVKQNDSHEWITRDPTGEDTSRILTIKRKEFSQEAEARLLFRFINNPPNSDGWEYNISVNDIYKEVIFHPAYPQHLFEANKKALEDAGFTNPIQKSDLYEFSGVSKVVVH